MVKNPPANAGDIRGTGLILDREDPLEEGVATYSSILAWKISWTEEPGGPWSRVTKYQTRLKRLSTQAHVSRKEAKRGQVYEVMVEWSRSSRK